MTNQGAKAVSVMSRAVSHWLFGLALVVVFNHCTSASATEYHVTITADSTNKTSLRGTIIKANAAGRANAIILTQSVYTLSVTGADEDACRSGDLDVTNGILTIIGTLSPNVVVMATNLGDRVFQVMSNAHLALQNVTIIGGTAPGDVYGTLAPGESGGAIYNSGILDAEGCVFFGNSRRYGKHASGKCGRNHRRRWRRNLCDGHPPNFTDCLIYGNAAGDGWDSPGGNGGGIFNGGTCVLNNCVVTNNRSGVGDGDVFAGNGGSGGGIFNQGNMVVTSCNISFNVCSRGADGGDFRWNDNLWPEWLFGRQWWRTVQFRNFDDGGLHIKL